MARKSKKQVKNEKLLAMLDELGASSEDGVESLLNDEELPPEELPPLGRPSKQKKV